MIVTDVVNTIVDSDLHIKNWHYTWNLLTIKSSGFAVVTALTLFGKEAAIPSAVMAIFVLLYLLYLSFRMEYKKRRIKAKINEG